MRFFKKKLLSHLEIHGNYCVLSASSVKCKHLERTK